VVPGVILAAGASSRMGRVKALLATGVPGECFLTRLVATLRVAGVDDVLVVVGADAEAIAAHLRAEPLPPRLVRNPNPERGQLSSLLCGLQVIDRPGVRGMLVTPVDVPFVAPGTVRAVLEAYRRTGAPVVRPVRHGRGGHPVVFDRQVFDDLRRADPAEGAKAVVHRWAPRGLDLPVDDEGAFLDIDSPADYAEALRRFGGPPSGDR
jgi:molybdenum cofactor cytidylyltransferase